MARGLTGSPQSPQSPLKTEQMTARFRPSGKRHTDREYEAELGAVREQILHMAAHVESMIANAVKALLHQDLELARSTMDEDHKVNRLEVDTDDLCLRILARRQPVASDLRFVTIALKMVTDLERIGDLAVDICERALMLRTKPPLSAYTVIENMADVVETMVRDAIDAFVNADPALAQEVVVRDQQVDDMYQSLCSEVVNVMRDDAKKVKRGIHVLSIAKFVERIGDHGTNLAEQVIFMIKGKDIRHLGKLGGSSNSPDGDDDGTAPAITDEDDA
jgi:phosphate transport system protein